jgi:hypothetical protein
VVEKPFAAVAKKAASIDYVVDEGGMPSWPSASPNPGI